MIGRRGHAALGAACALLVASCQRESLGVESRAAPAIGGASAAANPHNVLSAVVTVRVRGADSVAVRFRVADLASTVDSVTPAVGVAGDSAVVPVLGLLPGQRYVMRAVARTTATTTIGTPVEFTPVRPARLRC
jgi:hypothetical protein